jgi:hypothetical protein
VDNVNVQDFAFQVPIWIVIPLLLVVVVGVWKLGKLLWAALSH